MLPTDPTQADPSIVALMHGMKVQEGANGDYNTIGDKGTAAGIAQWSNQDAQGNVMPLQQGGIPTNFQTAANKYGLDANDFSPENQNKVLYSEIAEGKKEGLTPEQILSKHNSGDPQKYLNTATSSGTGQVGAYDVSSYVKNAMKAAQEYAHKSKQGFNPKPYSTNPSEFSLNTAGTQDTTQPQSEQNLGQKLGGRLQDISSNVSDISNQLQGKPGSQGWWSDILQTGGDVAGGLGDVINAGLELIPGVKGAENWVGGEVGKAADTQVGQSVVKFIQQEQQAHPEIAKDIGAGFNILTAIPILKGLGVVKDVAMSGLGTALKGVAENAVDSDLSKMAIASGKKGLQFVQENPGIYKQVAQEGLPLDMIEGKLSTQGAVDESWDRITDSNNQVKPVLDQPQYANVGADGQSIAQKALSGFTDRNGVQVAGLPESGMSPQELIDNARSLDPHNKLLWDKFEAGQANLKEINQLRSSLDSKVKAVFTDVPTVSASKEEGALLSGAMRDTVQTSAPETQPMFQNMSKMFKLQQALKYVEGKRIKTSLMRGAIQRIAGGLGGAGVARMMGGGIIPEAISAYAGEKAAGMLGRKTVGGILGSLVK